VRQANERDARKRERRGPREGQEQKEREEERRRERRKERLQMSAAVGRSGGPLFGIRRHAQIPVAERGSSVPVRPSLRSGAETSERTVSELRGESS
jgi:hypothetical protein